MSDTKDPANPIIVKACRNKEKNARLLLSRPQKSYVTGRLDVEKYAKTNYQNSIKVVLFILMQPTEKTMREK